MACIKALRTDFLTSSQSGGTFTFNGYDANLNETNPTGALPTNEPTALTGLNPGDPVAGGDNPSIDFSGTDEGVYSFTYTVISGSCTTSVTFLVPSIEGPNEGTDNSITACDADTNIIYLFDAISGGDGTNAVAANTLGVDTDGTWTISTATGAFFNGGVDPTTATFDMSVITAGSGSATFIATYTIAGITGSQIYGGTTYTQASGCDDCDQTTDLVTISIVSAGTAGTPSNVYVCS